jgi:hypothetical protein
MTNKAMKAARADVRGHEIPSRQRGQSGRNINGKRAMFTQRHGRLRYRGVTRRRDTQVMPGHPLAGLWPTGDRGMRRSHRPKARAYAALRIEAENMAWIDEMYGRDL